jgi:hypothetical protein
MVVGVFGTVVIVVGLVVGVIGTVVIVVGLVVGIVGMVVGVIGTVVIGVWYPLQYILQFPLLHVVDTELLGQLSV